MLIDLLVLGLIKANTLHKDLLVAEVVFAELVRITLLRSLWLLGLGLRATTRGTLRFDRGR